MFACCRSDPSGRDLTHELNSESVDRDSVVCRPILAYSCMISVGHLGFVLITWSTSPGQKEQRAATLNKYKHQVVEHGVGRKYIRF